eukprot:sb/3475310/
MPRRYGRRQEIREQRRIQVEELVQCYGYTDRAAFLALSQNSWDLSAALQSLKKAAKTRRKPAERGRVSSEVKKPVQKRATKTYEDEPCKVLLYNSGITAKQFSSRSVFIFLLSLPISILYFPSSILNL